MCVSWVNCIWWWGSSSGTLGIVENPFQCHYSPVHSNPEWCNLLGSHLELFNHLNVSKQVTDVKLNCWCNIEIHETISSSSPYCHAISTDIPDPSSPPLPIFNCFRKVFQATSRICTELLYVGSSWSFCLCSSILRGPQEYITYKPVPTSPAVSRMSGSSNLDSFRDGWLVAEQLLLCEVLPPGLVQNCLQHSCVAVVKLFSIRLVSVHVVHPCNSIDTTAA